MKLQSKEAPFRFRRFSVSHYKSSMKVGVDGVLIGCWGNATGSKGLDAGCGCGLIALMCAQRNPLCSIDAVDIDAPSIEEAQYNFNNSPWSARLKAVHSDLSIMAGLAENAGKYDFIISNPPFFDSGIKPVGSREIARHQSIFNPYSLIFYSSRLLKDNGTLSMILTYDGLKDLNSANGMLLERICIVSNKPDSIPKRAMVTLRKVGIEDDSNKNVTEEFLMLRNNDGSYSEEYLSLTRDFYLNLRRD